MVVYASDSWKMVHLMLGLWLKADSSGFLLRRHSRVGVSVLKFDDVSRDMLPWSDSFNDNDFASGKLFWRSVKLLISDGAASNSGEEMIYLLLLSGEGHALIFCIGLSHLFSPILSVFMWPVTKSLFY